MAQEKNQWAEMEYVDLFGEHIRVHPKINMYANNNNLYVGLDYFDKEFVCWEPYCDVTVNVRKLPFLESAIDTNNNGDRILKFLVDQGFGELTSKVQPSGFSVFPVFRFNPDKLREIDPVMFSEYEKAAGFKEVAPKSLDVSIREAEAADAAEKSSSSDRNKDSRSFNER